MLFDGACFGACVAELEGDWWHWGIMIVVAGSGVERMSGWQAASGFSHRQR